ncbi:uncharacterized protein A1O9_09905 [Exophiala aquamarina CBS 119918]|uniref:aldehyde dehydrogenase (NAD(+)) n=1 Tax=Exophiala aquamarina CBS 119918 TaxID=1182545 RepID=A0A072PEU5_9EURO|nr:uncharacterized protein A1O9_09905 [Exophiala aquamarina CBS 119918]KEF54110.1 hypothetical protein A1O9_09905 [Exophiala aquamarina CBS 119918]
MQFPFSTSNLPRQLFVNNEYVDARNTTKAKVFNPSDGSLVAEDVPVAGAEDVDYAVSCAEKAFPAWRKLAPKARTKILLRFADLVEQHTSVLGDLTRLTLGTTPAFNEFEAGLAADGIRYYLGWIDKFNGETFPQDDGFLKIIRHEPLGVTAGIVPWNGPLITLGLKAAPALVTGNCFIFKPSEKTPFATIALGILAKEAGLPPGVFQVLPGDGTTGALLASHMRIRKISFTGSISTGKRVQELAAKSNLKRVTLELGGKSPAVVFDDCDLGNAIKWTVDGITTFSGQVCVASSRVFVHENIYDKFLEQYVASLREKASKLGDPSVPRTELGPLVDEAQFNRVSGFIERAQTGGGGKQLTGGPRENQQGYYIDPVVFEEPALDSEIYNQEIFGPVSVIRKFKTEEEVLALSNNSEYGLMAGVFTQDINRAMRIAAEFESGMVGINCISLNFLSAPFGGAKQSGLGRECGISALHAFTEPKTVMINLTY